MPRGEHDDRFASLIPPPMALVRDHSVPGNEFSRRELLKRLAAGVVAAPAILRGRYPLFRPADARFPVEYSARAIKLVQE